MNREITEKKVTLESIADSILLMSEAISKSVNSVSERVDKLSVRVDGLSQDTKSLSSRVDGLSQDTKSLSSRIDGLAKKVDDLPTRKEFVSLEKRLDDKINTVGVRLEKQIDDLAISVHNEFDRMHIRLDDMDTHLVSLKNNDLKLDKRVRRLEGAVFA